MASAPSAQPARGRFVSHLNRQRRPGESLPFAGAARADSGEAGQGPSVGPAGFDARREVARPARRGRGLPGAGSGLSARIANRAGVQGEHTGTRVVSPGLEQRRPGGFAGRHEPFGLHARSQRRGRAGGQRRHCPVRSRRLARGLCLRLQLPGRGDHLVAEFREGQRSPADVGLVRRAQAGGRGGQLSSLGEPVLLRGSANRGVGARGPVRGPREADKTWSGKDRRWRKRAAPRC